MSGGGLKLRDASKLADSRAVFEFEVPLDALPDLPSEFTADEGASVHVVARFAREQGRPRAELSLDGELPMICQRCMQPMRLPLHTEATVLIVESEQDADTAPAGLETFLAPEGRLSLEALAVEELLLALPIVPLHAAGEACAGLREAQQAPVQEADTGSTTRPFAELRDLLRSRNGTPEN